MHHRITQFLWWIYPHGGSWLPLSGDQLAPRFSVSICPLYALLWIVGKNQQVGRPELAPLPGYLYSHQMELPRVGKHTGYVLEGPSVRWSVCRWACGSWVLDNFWLAFTITSNVHPLMEQSIIGVHIEVMVDCLPHVSVNVLCSRGYTNSHQYVLYGNILLMIFIFNHHIWYLCLYEYKERISYYWW